MPIYAYRCAACGVGQDVLQKMSDPPLRTCSHCGQHSMEKQVTAAGFQLKGSGWYVTDFRTGGGDAAKKAKPNAAEGVATEGGAANSSAQEPKGPAGDAASCAPDKACATPSGAPKASASTV